MLHFHYHSVQNTFWPSFNLSSVTRVALIKSYVSMQGQLKHSLLVHNHPGFTPCYEVIWEYVKIPGAQSCWHRTSTLTFREDRVWETKPKDLPKTGTWMIGSNQQFSKSLTPLGWPMIHFSSDTNFTKSHKSFRFRHQPLMGCPGYLYFCLADYKFYGSYNPHFKFDNFLEQLAELRNLHSGL